MEGDEVTVRGVREVGPDTIAIDLETPDGFDAEPGQFVQVGLETDDGYVVRHYTISSPYINDGFEVTVEIDPEGSLSPLLKELGSGDTIDVDGPYGRVYYEGEDNAVVLAGGPGVGPAIGISERIIEEGGGAAIVYMDDEPVHRERLERLIENGVSVAITPRDEDITDAVRNAVQDTDGRVFVYGFSDFVEKALEALKDQGVNQEDVKIERFD